MISHPNVSKHVSIRHENGPRRVLRGPFPLVAGTGFEPRPLGYELTGRGPLQYARSHSCRSSTFSRPTCLAPSRLFASVPPCSVSKSVANPLSDKYSPAASGGARVRAGLVADGVQFCDLYCDRSGIHADIG